MRSRHLPASFADDLMWAIPILMCFFGTEVQESYAKIWPLSEIFPTQPEIGLILFQGTSPTSPNHYKWNKECGSQWGHGMSYGQNDPSPKKSSQNFRITFRLMGLRTPGGKGFRPHFSFGLGFLDPKTPTALLKQQSTTFCVDSQIKLIHPKWKLDNYCYGYPPPKPRYPTSGKGKIIFKHTRRAP